MKEIKVGKYSKEWYRKIRELHSHIVGIITFIGISSLCFAVVLDESCTVYDWFTTILLIIGIALVLATVMYKLFHLESDINGEYFNEHYDRFIYNKIYRDRIKQNKKYHKWIM